MNVFLIGAGCGPGTYTQEARSAIEQSDLVIGSSRLIGELPFPVRSALTEVRPEAVLSLLLAHNIQCACILLSGDTGFYSGARRLIPLFEGQGMKVKVLPGISSLQSFSARLLRPWQDWRLCSAHGTECDPVFEVMQGKHVFFLTSGEDGPAGICHTLTQAGLGHLEIILGERLGLPGEQIICGSAAEFSQRRFDGLNVLLVQPAPSAKRRTPGIPDDEFEREKIPMTKQEVRTAIMAKLAIAQEDICWDIGAGTGSVSVELALHARQVWAVEQNPQALALANRNREKFCAWNLHLVEGTAPEALNLLPRPDAVFIGGSDGHLEEILKTTVHLAPQARICVSAIALETLSGAIGCLHSLGYETEITQMSVSRSHHAGSLHLMLAQNPVFLIMGKR